MRWCKCNFFPPVRMLGIVKITTSGNSVNVGFSFTIAERRWRVFRLPFFFLSRNETERSTMVLLNVKNGNARV